MLFKEKIKYVEGTIYDEFHRRLGRQPNVRTIDETLDYILNHQCSVSRFGDGEFAVAMGGAMGFKTMTNLYK